MSRMNRAGSALVLGIAVAGLVISAPGRACTTAMVPGSKTKVMGKNYVWSESYGRVFLNRKNMKKTAMLKAGVARPLTWKAIYPSLTFNQYAENFPNGGVNSKGVAIEILLGPGEFPKGPEEGKSAINELQWIQYILDTADSTREALRQASKVDIVPLSKYAVHYHVCDRAGECAIVEYERGRLVASHAESDGENPVGCTNSSHSQSLPKRKAGEIKAPAETPRAAPIENPRLLARPVYPLGGSARITALVEAFGKETYETAADEVTAMFALMQQLGTGPQWQIVYELEGKRVHFRARVDNGGRRIRSVALEDLFGATEADCRESLWTDPDSKVRYVLPAPRLNLAAEKIVPAPRDESPVLTKIRLADFSQAHEKPSLLSESRDFLRAAGIEDKKIEELFYYNSRQTACVMRD